MRNRHHLQIVATSLLIASLGVSSLAAAARADSGPWLRYRQGSPNGRVDYVPGRVIVQQDVVGPAFAAFIGGLVLGSSIQAQAIYTNACAPQTVIVSSKAPCDDDWRQEQWSECRYQHGRGHAWDHRHHWKHHDDEDDEQ